MTGALRHQRYRSDDIRRDAGLDPDAVGFGPTLNMVFFDAPIEIDGASVEYRIWPRGSSKTCWSTCTSRVRPRRWSSTCTAIRSGTRGPRWRTTTAGSWRSSRALLPIRPLRSGAALLLPGEEALLAGFERGLERDYSIETEHILDRFAAQVASTPEGGGGVRTTAASTPMPASTRSVRSCARAEVTRVGLGDRIAIVPIAGGTGRSGCTRRRRFGAAYVPLDPADPAGRRDWCWVRRIRSWSSTPSSSSARASTPIRWPDGPSEPLTGTGAPSYVYFTWSTGTPRGGAGHGRRGEPPGLDARGIPDHPRRRVALQDAHHLDRSVSELFGPGCRWAPAW